MDFFENRYSPEDHYDENDEKEREQQRILASMLEAAADAPDFRTSNVQDYPDFV